MTTRSLLSVAALVSLLPACAPGGPLPPPVPASEAPPARTPPAPPDPPIPPPPPLPEPGPYAKISLQKTLSLQIGEKISGVGDGHRAGVGDLNGDGWPDLVIARVRSGSLSVYLNRGKGQLRAVAAQAPYRTGLGPQEVLVADLDRDGRPDVVTADSLDGTVSVLRNQGGGALAPAARYPVARGPHSLAVADFNGDGWADLAVGCGGNVITVLLNRKDGTFPRDGGARYGAAGQGPPAVGAADIDRDGWQDLVVINSQGRPVVLPNRKDGTFAGQAAPQEADLPEWRSAAVAIGDINRDGLPDVAMTFDSGTYHRTFLHDGKDALREDMSLRLGTDAGIALSDLNHDGRLDVTFLVYGGGISLIYQRPEGLVSGCYTDGDYSACSSPRQVLSADLDQDGFAEVILGCAEEVAVLHNAGPQQ